MNKHAHTTRRNLALSGPALLLVAAALVSACEPKTDITFQNQQVQDIKIYVTHVRDDGSIDGFADHGTVPAQTTKTLTITFLGDEWVNRIKAVDSSGYAIFSHDYSRKELEKTKWKIVIPP